MKLSTVILATAALFGATTNAQNQNLGAAGTMTRDVHCPDRWSRPNWPNSFTLKKGEAVRVLCRTRGTPGQFFVYDPPLAQFKFCSVPSDSVKFPDNVRVGIQVCPLDPLRTYAGDAAEGA